MGTFYAKTVNETWLAVNNTSKQAIADANAEASGHPNP